MSSQAGRSQSSPMVLRKGVSGEDLSLLSELDLMVAVVLDVIVVCARDVSCELQSWIVTRE